MIELSVALPMYKSKHIAWLALESLCRQENINFNWELIVIEEKNECLSEKNLLRYSNKLSEVGCSRIFYKQLDKWISLYEKWKMIATEIDSNSKVFLLKAADCFSQFHRLEETHKIIAREGYDWVASPMGPFYDIETEFLAIYEDRTRIGGLNMAIKPDFIKNIPSSKIARKVDTAIVRESRKLCNDKGLNFKNTFNNSKNWKYGVDTNGLNNISWKRLELMKNYSEVFRKSELTIDDILPEDIVIKLKECKQYCRKEYIN